MPTNTNNTPDYLAIPEDVALYLDAALQQDDPKLLPAALRDIVNSQGGMTVMSARTGLNRESLYKSLSENGNPKLSTLFEIIQSLGLHLSIKRLEFVGVAGSYPSKHPLLDH